MSDAAMGSGWLGRGSGSKTWIALLALGFAAAVGAALHSQGSLIETLRADRISDVGQPAGRTSVSLPLGNPSVPPDVDARRPAPASAPASAISERAVRRPPAAVTVAALESRFDALDYRLAPIRTRNEPVPRVTVEAVPADLDALVEVDQRKALFIKMVLPLVLITDERLAADRARIIALRDRRAEGKALSAEDADWLAGRFECYRVEAGDFDLLLRRVDIVPPSLAMAQAAVESGWGTSRFAREANALFGQWVWGAEADGIVPERRLDGLSHKIRAFETPLKAVAAYVGNLNTHRAYRAFRRIRATLRRRGAGLDGMTLAAGLESYSQKRRDYVGLLRSVISANRLQSFDRARLADRSA